MTQERKYILNNPVRILTATSLFDGHDVSINIMRRIMQGCGAEVIHLGHDRSVNEIVKAAIEEDVQAIAVTSYQGGHMEYFKYMRDILDEKGYEHVRIFGGGGGVILPDEISRLHDYGITGIFSPDDGRRMGLQGMINEVLRRSDFSIPDIDFHLDGKFSGLNNGMLGHVITRIENSSDGVELLLRGYQTKGENEKVPVLGITGPGGSGKSSLTDEFVRRWLDDYPEQCIAIISIDPSRRKTGGALLGDRIRMNSVNHHRVFMRSMATRVSDGTISKHLPDVLSVLSGSGYHFIIIETSGIGQSDTSIVDFCDYSLYVMTPEYGAPSQLEKIGMLDYADAVALNKFEKQGGDDALRDVRKQYQRNHMLFDKALNQMPVYPTHGNRFNDGSVEMLYRYVMKGIMRKVQQEDSFVPKDRISVPVKEIIPSSRLRYLSEIVEVIRNYNAEAFSQADMATELQYILKVLENLYQEGFQNETVEYLEQRSMELKGLLGDESLEMLAQWPELKRQYLQNKVDYLVRGQNIQIEAYFKTLSNNAVSKVSLPDFQGWGDLLRWMKTENIPGHFPFAAGIFPFRREQEDPTRMFAGEGSPERTNERFHYLSQGMLAVRLSTAFDSVTLYGRDPDMRPDVFGKIGNSGVSISSLDDVKKLYSGFPLNESHVSVSMTINGPASVMLAAFFNAAIDQACERYLIDMGRGEETREFIIDYYRQKGLDVPSFYGALPNGNSGLGLLLLGMPGHRVVEHEVYQKIRQDTLKNVRGTVQADILKEDQAQNTCIFSTEFALRLMGDVQQYFIDKEVRNFYSVSISGYHIAEAGANPVTQLAFTLANAFTYVEYYLARGMKIDDFASNLSFFFSNGLDAEYAVMGRVARIIWAKAMRYYYKGDVSAQKLKYHIQTSGRSLHAQEIGFNDIRTTLQAMYAVNDNCNSLHTNAYDEAVTTPTEESVRRALAIQLIINKELGLSANQNPLQGAFVINELTSLVENAVMKEFERISDRGGVLGAMETLYQRGRIQEESHYYEKLKHNGQLPVVGVNTFLSKQGSPTIMANNVVRSTEEERLRQVNDVARIHRAFPEETQKSLEKIQRIAIEGGDLFDALMDGVGYCSMGQITEVLFEVGGRYRRNM